LKNHSGHRAGVLRCEARKGVERDASVHRGDGLTPHGTATPRRPSGWGGTGRPPALALLPDAHGHRLGLRASRSGAFGVHAALDHGPWRSQRWPLWFFNSLLSLALLTGCGGDGHAPEAPDGAGPTNDTSGFPVAIVDDEGARISLSAAPTRIVSLVPSSTEILRAIGLTDHLVGRTDFDTDPDLAHLPSVGGGLEPSPERLISLEPDLVIRFGGESDRATPGHLDRSGIPHIAVRPDRIRDIRRIIALLGDATGRPESADSLLQVMDEELEALTRAVEGVSRPSVAFVLGGDPPWLVGPDTYLNELLELAGARNAFTDVGRDYAPMSVEEILRREVDLLLALPDARIPSALRDLPLRRVPGELQLPDHRVARSARILARTLHPERFP